MKYTFTLFLLAFIRLLNNLRRFVMHASVSAEKKTGIHRKVHS